MKIHPPVLLVTCWLPEDVATTVTTYHECTTTMATNVMNIEQTWRPLLLLIMNIGQR